MDADLKGRRTILSLPQPWRIKQQVKVVACRRNQKPAKPGGGGGQSLGEGG